mmetsp:Transcript_1214/g.3216  ORF Transcript_1214/g.3216 Transcript_1214/m.3216 type:complete len:535 (+) Transcript_1214:54-1658(+)|eukprot:CAMPEP_0119135080 /NCGR_PEP_ID=MMETSP1310-20130426/18604_1 /TAXON_ID=464262 /ORGANISM="Genus nov. species nov., Strain RCC2339" /LENGTH=534 /DNA_ID=CAMNT_0007125935 /DNA_START=51 /DNA_END=1655 /DNA_ORIENTATION=+
MSRLLLVVVVFTLVLTVGCAGFNVFEATIGDIQNAFALGELSSCVELAGLYGARIDAYEDDLRSLVHRNPRVQRDAEVLDTMSSEERAALPLWCIPFVSKDNIDKSRDEFGMPTTAGSDTLRENFAKENAVLLQRMLDAGALLLGSANMATFATDGSNTNSSVRGQTRNTFDPRRTPMGSSGGTATAVSASLCAIGLGSDTNGSIQNPANVQSLAGLRPTVGLVPTGGTFPLFDLQDTFGPIGRSVRDLALLMNVLDNGRPPKTLIAPHHSYPTEPVAGSLQGVRVGLLNDTIFPFPDLPTGGGLAGAQATDPGARSAVLTIADEMTRLGAEVVVLEDVAQRVMGIVTADFLPSLPCNNAEEIGSWNYYLGHMVTADSPAHNVSQLYDLIAANPNETPGIAEAMVSANQSANYPYAAVYQPSCEAYSFLRQTIIRTLEGELLDHNLDVFLYAPMRGPASILGESIPFTFSTIAAVSGNPALVIPAGVTDTTHPPMPVGATLLATRFQEARLLQWGMELEANYPHRQIPSFSPPL